MFNSIFQHKESNMMTDKLETQKKIGIVRILNDTYGFISDNEEDRFFHWSYMAKNSMKPFHHLRVGDRVSFIPKMKNDKPQAEEVAIVPFDKDKSKVM